MLKTELLAVLSDAKIDYKTAAAKIDLTKLSFDSAGNYIYPQKSAYHNLKRTLLRELGKIYKISDPEIQKIYELID